jgi:hypothetical protein
MEAMPLHHAGEASALGPTNNVHQVSGFEDVHGYRLAYTKLAYVISLNFPQVAGMPAILEMTGSCLVKTLRFPETQLDRFVTVGLLGLNLSHYTRARLYYSDRDHPAIITKNLGHTDFSA